MVLLALTTIFLIFWLAILAFYKHKYKYWARKGVPFIQPNIPLGSQENPLNPKRAHFQALFELYNSLKKDGHKFGGVYFGANPKLLLIDPEVIKNILLKDFLYFYDRGSYYNEKNDPLSAHLFNLEGQRWRNLRAKLTPTFTSGKMKSMFSTLLNCGEQMMEKIHDLSERNEPIDSKDILSRFNIDIIGSCAFGLECNSFKGKESEFREQGKKLFLINWWNKLRFMMITMAPDISRNLGVPLFDRKLTNFYLNIVKNVVKYRENNEVNRNDFIQILVDLKNNNNQEGGSHNLTVEEIAAQSFVFFVAGYETASTVMNYCLFELAQNEEIQERVRDEILKTLKKHDGKVTYESVMETKYLGQVIDGKLLLKNLIFCYLLLTFYIQKP